MVKKPNLNPLQMGALTRETVRHLHAYVATGKLKIRVQGDMDVEKVGRQPRVWYGHPESGTAWYSGTEGVPFLSSPLPSPSYRGALTQETLAAVAELERAQEIEWGLV